MTLPDVRAILAKESPGKWTHNRIFEEVDVAVASQLMPSMFWSASENDRAYLIAHKRAKSTMEAYEHHLHEKEMERQSKKNKPKGNR